MTNVVGLDKAQKGGDYGCIVEGYYLDGVFTMTKYHMIKRDNSKPCVHDFAVTDDILDFCIHCGETRPVSRPISPPHLPQK